MTLHDHSALIPEGSPPPQQGCTESQREGLLQETLAVASAFTGAATALLIEDGSLTGYRAAHGLTPRQLAELERAMTNASQGDGLTLDGEPSWQLLATLPLVDDSHLALGKVCLLSRDAVGLTERHTAGLQQLANHLQRILRLDRQRVDARNLPRAPGAATFVPGLVHEMGSFIFGISASLDALEARLPGLPEVGTYGANIRRSLDRMGAFMGELREYGYPQRLAWTTVEPDPLIRSAVEASAAQAQERGIELVLQVEGTLPSIQADAEGLQLALTRLVGLLVHHEDPGGYVRLRVATTAWGNRVAIRGQLHFHSRKMDHLDLSRLFEPFYFRSSGLGRLTLPGVRRVLESHGGSLSASLDQDGKIMIVFMLPS